MDVRASGQYYGAKRIELNVGGIRLSEYQYLESGTPWHYHEHPYFMYVLQGNMTDINSYRTRLIPSGSLVFHNWQDPHLNEKKSAHARGFHVEMDRGWFFERKLDVNLWEGSQVLERPDLHHLLAKLYYEFKTQDEYSSLSIELLLMQLCEHIEDRHKIDVKKEPIWINALKEIIHYESRKLTLAYLSDQLGVHPVHISRSIPIYMNASLGEYIRQQKIKRAFNYMMNPNYTISQIAYECGFTDQSHFTKTFKSYFGKTPRVFRHRLVA